MMKRMKRTGLSMLLLSAILLLVFGTVHAQQGEQGDTPQCVTHRSRARPARKCRLTAATTVSSEF
jgi:hypothetical protein